MDPKTAIGHLEKPELRVWFDVKLLVLARDVLETGGECPCGQKVTILAKRRGAV